MEGRGGTKSIGYTKHFLANSCIHDRVVRTWAGAVVLTGAIVLTIIFQGVRTEMIHQTPDT